MVRVTFLYRRGFWGRLPALVLLFSNAAPCVLAGWSALSSTPLSSFKPGASSGPRGTSYILQQTSLSELLSSALLPGVRRRMTAHRGINVTLCLTAGCAYRNVAISICIYSNAVVWLLVWLHLCLGLYVYSAPEQENSGSGRCFMSRDIHSPGPQVRTPT